MTFPFDSSHQPPRLPPHCTPTNSFLEFLSSTLNTCIPTPLALLSTLFGILSIVSWLFAQLPQIYKNHAIKSTSGLSVFFLSEWLLGDVSNLIGSILTGQATWQLVLAAYYCFVDCCLVGQWIWYERLRHSRRLRDIWRWKKEDASHADNRKGVEGVSSILVVPPSPGGLGRPVSSFGSESTNASTSAAPKTIPTRPNTIFRMPTFEQRSSPKDSLLSVTPLSDASSSPGSSRQIRRVGLSNSPMPSPKTVLYLSLLLAIITQSQASPLAAATISHPSTISTTRISDTSVSMLIGTATSWLCTFLYLASRLPQLHKNLTRKSVAGLSFTLFAAAFFGNLFYSLSLLSNPRAWASYGPHGAHGWIGPDGSDRREWALSALPFFLGAAGVLAMDAAIGVQFLMYGERKEARARVVVEVAPKKRDVPKPKGPEQQQEAAKLIPTPSHAIPIPSPGKLHPGFGDTPSGSPSVRWQWRRVSGWMRGWMPEGSQPGTPGWGVGAEGRPLLGPYGNGNGIENGARPAGRSGESSSSGGSPARGYGGV